MSEKTVPSTSTPKTRPYTSYNLFFQLEREYILQKLLGYQPMNTISQDDIFDPSNAKSNYQGCPSLPPRYADLVLPFDWHIPGKGRRRKRLHRKSHGMIGFHELNDQISRAWKAVDEDVKDFCTKLAEIEATKYKKIEANAKQQGVAKKKDAKKSTKSTEKSSIIIKMLTKEGYDEQDHDMFYNSSNDIIPFDWSTNENLNNDIQTGSPQIRRVTSCDSFHPEDDPQGHFSPQAIATEVTPNNSCSEFNYQPTEVMMTDDEIMDIWESIPLERCNNVKNGSNTSRPTRSMISSTTKDTSTFDVCMEIPSDPMLPQPEVVVTPLKLDKGIVDCGNDGKRMSFIEEEYTRFKEIGDQFLQLRRISTSGLKRRAFAARQA